LRHFIVRREPDKTTSVRETPPGASALGLVLMTERPRHGRGTPRLGHRGRTRPRSSGSLERSGKAPPPLPSEFTTVCRAQPPSRLAQGWMARFFCTRLRDLRKKSQRATLGCRIAADVIDRCFQCVKTPENGFERRRLADEHAGLDHPLVIVAQRGQRSRLRNQFDWSPQACIVVGVGRAVKDFLVFHNIHE